VAFIDLRPTDVKSEALPRISEEYARRHTLVPFDVAGGEIHVAI
jgi:hypothetical protein